MHEATCELGLRIGDLTSLQLPHPYLVPATQVGVGLSSRICTYAEPPLTVPNCQEQEALKDEDVKAEAIAAAKAVAADADLDELD